MDANKNLTGNLYSRPLPPDRLTPVSRAGAGVLWTKASLFASIRG